MREITLKIAFVIGVLLMIQSCYYEYPPEPSPINLDNVSFKRDVLPVLSNTCAIAECHDGTKYPDLRADTVYGNVTYAYRDLVIGSPSSTPKGETFVNTTFPDKSVLLDAILNGVGGIDMPPDGALSARDIDLIRAWMLKGALND